MAITKVPTYPANARNAAWQQRKKFIDKVKKSGKTGLGTLLEKAEKEFAKVDFNKLDAKRLQKATGTLTTPKAVSAAKLAAQRHVAGSLTAAEKAVADAARKAHIVADNTALSTTARAASDAIGDNLDALATALDPSRVILADFDAYKFALEEQSKKQRTLIKNLLEKVTIAGDIVNDLPTARDYAESGLHDYVQELDKALNKSPEPAITKWAQQHWAPLASDSYFPKEDNDVIPKLIEVLTTARTLKKMLP
jgi:hypothetical protein